MDEYGWGLTSAGFRRPTYNELLDALEHKARELFGATANLTVRSPLGLFLRIFASLSIHAAAVWWLRSPNYNNINNNNYFCAVSSSGSLDYNNANNAYPLNLPCSHPRER